MAEPLGATLGAVSLATALSGTLVSAVECFEYLELGRRFNKDFEKSQARLAALKLQITRWGISTGVFPDPRTGRQRTVSVNTHTSDTAKELLEKILEDIEEVERKSEKYHNQPLPASGADFAALGRNDMDAPTQALISQTNTIIAERVRGVHWTKKAKWALHEKKHFDRLLEDVTENLGHLEKLLPQVAETQRELCHFEVGEVQHGQSEAVMKLLHDASQANKDTLLEQAVREAIISRGAGHRWERTEIGDDVKLEQGDRIAQGYTGQAPVGRIGHDYGVTVGTGRSTIHQGDTYGST